jgi:arsenite-transporting ATPase
MNNELKQRILPNGSTKYIFFGGKGGVGKTTSASATAIWFADHGYNTTIVSTDPTVSLSVVFGQEIGGEEMVKIQHVPNLCGMNINPKDAKGHYKKRFESIMGQFNSAVGEEASQTPCADEMATFDQFVTFLDEPPSRVIVFDTAPTGKSLRELALPFNWAAYIQKQIKEGKEMAKLMNLSEDSYENLEKDKVRYDHAMSVLKDKDHTVFNLVMLPERLPIEETASAISGLSQHDIPVQSLVINQVIFQKDIEGNPFLQGRADLQSKFLKEIQDRFSGLLHTEVPLLAQDVSDIDGLRRVGELLYGG